jgi:hypothetical protein
MKIALSLAALLAQVQVLGSEQPLAGDVEIKCACEKDKKDERANPHSVQKVDKISQDWTAITGIHPPDIRNIVIKDGSEFQLTRVN